MNQREVLYKKDKLGNTRIWYVEYDNEKYKTISGIKNGNLVHSGYTYVEEKNVGKTNATSLSEQVLSEVDAMYIYQLNQGRYHVNEKDIGKGAKFVECMLAATFDKKKHNAYPYIAQPKFDGGRCIGVDGQTQTRQGKFFVSVPHIENDIAAFEEKFPGYYLDGELYNHDLKDNFEKIMSLIKKKKPSDDELHESSMKVFYYVYDIITPVPMSTTDRIQFLKDNVYGKYPNIREVESVIINNDEERDAMFIKHVADGYEGTMLRDPNGIYTAGRNKNLIKCKVFQDVEAKLLALTDGDGIWMGCAKSATVELADGTIQESNIKGNQAYLRKILMDKDKYIGGDVTIKFQDYTSFGRLQFPYITYFWGCKRDI